jgi:hypothetical protein
MPVDEVNDFLIGTNEMLKNANFQPDYGFVELPEGASDLECIAAYFQRRAFENGKAHPETTVAADFSLTPLGTFEPGILDQRFVYWLFDVQSKLTKKQNRQAELAEFNGLLFDAVGSAKASQIADKPEWAQGQDGVEEEHFLFHRDNRHWLLCFGWWD